MYNIVNLIDTVDNVNYGIWSAALINASNLINQNVKSYAVFPDKKAFSYADVDTFSFNHSKEIFSFFETNDLTTQNTLIVSHGCWRWPTKIAYALRKKGYKWMVVPHGMLEPWSMQQKKFKKSIYYHLIEKQLLKKADMIRAVSKPEYRRLNHTFGEKVILIPNGINPISNGLDKPTKKPIRFLFMARLHHKKGVVPLLEGWLLSPLANNADYELQIAGPDDGELSKLESLIVKFTNVKYLGAVYNSQKDALLRASHIYILPSYSEGFPSSVLEAMDYGLLPLISQGCNFPEAFENNLVVEVKPNAAQIAHTLTKISELTLDAIIAKGSTSRDFIGHSYTNAIISAQLDDVFRQLLAS